MDKGWTLEKIENYCRASEYTAFHRKLSVLIEPYLDESWTLADIGCGPGLIDIWLASMVAGIDAIDADRVVIDNLSARLDGLFLTNRRIAEKIKPRLASVQDLKNESWDAVLMSFFGINGSVLDAVLPLARERLFVFMHGRSDTEGPLAAYDNGDKFSMAEMETFLEQRGIMFKKSVMEMQFGQPFKTIEDIHRFLSEYEGVSDTRMTDIEERIVVTDRFDYPYYLPKSISVALFIVVGSQAT